VDDEFARAHGWTVPALARACLDGGAQLLQIRVKSAGAARVLSVCEEVAASTGEAALVVNDRADVARLVPGSGVHVGQDDLPPVLARRIVGPDVIVGLSTHTPAQVDAALREPITYLAVGPVFGTRTKETGYQAVGLDLVRYAADLARRHGAESGTAPTPVVAIGGITLDTARSVLEAGAASVAVVSDILATRDPASRVADLVAVLRG
jgi:thiamine-phosphate pyrophosphorylase